MIKISQPLKSNTNEYILNNNDYTESKDYV